MQIIPVEGSSIPKKCTNITGLGNGHNCRLLRGHPGIRKSRSRTALLLDRILNDDSEVLTKSYASEDSSVQSGDVPLTTNENVAQDHQMSPEQRVGDVTVKPITGCDHLQVEQSNSQSTNQNPAALESTNHGASSGKHFSHKRSTSDFGIHTHGKGHSIDRTLRATSSSSLSCSLPNGSEGW